jgi:hypothetical protein
LKAKVKKFAKKIKKAEAQGNEDKARKFSQKRQKARRELKKVSGKRSDAQMKFDYACPEIPPLF